MLSEHSVLLIALNRASYVFSFVLINFMTSLMVKREMILNVSFPLHI